MFVKPKMDYCDQSILLQWNAYEDFASGAGVEYVIYVSENGNTYREVGTSKDPRFKYSELVNGNNYCFYVQGWENDGVGPISSSSAVVCLDADFIRKPAFAYMRYASVVDTNLTRMCMKIDLEGDIGEYWVKRANKVDGGYKVIATVELPDPLTPADSNFCFDDIDVNTTKMSYYYKIDVVDPCGEVGKSSNVGRTILLSVLADNEKNRNFLTWNHYQEWAGGVMEYEVWRGTSVSNIVKIASLPLSQAGSIDGMTVNSEGIQYIDDVSGNSNIQGNGEFCYFVVAKEGSGTFMQIEPEISKSNTVCAVQSPLFYVPNSFTPNGDGVNDYFMPKGAFHDVKAYSLEVFNRWGEKIYSTDNYSAKGWDGSYKGVNAPSGSYVYIVRYTSADGQDYEQRGTVSINR
jgi:gliding motility-associated-like protein